MAVDCRISGPKRVLHLHLLSEAISQFVHRCLSGLHRISAILYIINSMNRLSYLQLGLSPLPVRQHSQIHLQMLNLKGNLEMNLSARLGTAANMGDLDEPTTRRAIIIGNLALLQVQAALVSFVAACFSFLLSVILPSESSANSSTARAHRPQKPEHPGHLSSGFNE